MGATARMRTTPVGPMYGPRGLMRPDELMCSCGLIWGKGIGFGS